MNCPRSANMFMIRAPFPRAVGTDSGVLESIGSTEGRVSSPCCVCIGPRNIALDHQRFVEASGGGQGANTGRPRKDAFDPSRRC